MPNKTIEQIENRKTKTSDLLETMMDVMQNIEYIDDVAYGLRMKILNNIEFLVDTLMEEYESGR